MARRRRNAPVVIATRDRAVVLRAITRLNIGGPARQALLLTEALEDSFPTILVAGEPDFSEGELNDPAVPVRRIALKRKIDPWSDMHAYRSLRRLIDANGIQIVHTHMAKAGTVGRMAATRASRPPATVHTFHGHVLQGYFSRPAERFFLGIERALARRTDTLVAVSEEVRDELLDLGIGRPEQWRVIPLGFDLSSLLSVSGHSGVLRSRLSLDEETFLVAVLGRLAPIKDHVTLVQAMAQVPAAHLAILGEGETKPAIERAARDLGISSRIHFMGWITDVASAIADADVVALTSRNEGTPVSLIEAGAAGRPVVSTAVGGVRSVVRDGSTGFVVPPQDPRAAADAINKLLADRTLAERFGSAGRTHVAGRFSKERLIADVRELYEHLLGSRH